MQTNFTLAQLADPDIAEADKILRACVHCGFCTATCPTYVLLGDELDSPRGRIYLIKDMLEKESAPTRPLVTHIDRCLSCLSCMTTCPSGVHYMHLVDVARHRIEESYERPLGERLLRRFLAAVLPYPLRFRIALIAAHLTKPLARFLPGRLQTMASLAPQRIAAPSFVDRPQVFAAKGARRKRVALLTGCAQQVLMTEINEATVRLLTRHGCEVVVAKGAGCCGALTHHLGQDAKRMARANIDAWQREKASGGLDAIVINAAGCGTMVKDYGFLLRDDPAYAVTAAEVAALAKDISEIIDDLGLSRPVIDEPLRVAYHAACSLQHGQRLPELPKRLLDRAGFQTLAAPEGHLCCGSAGSYNLLQPALATVLRDRKLAHIEGTTPDLIASGNIGCITQLAAGTTLPVLHTVELLDWATGGPMPAGLARRQTSGAPQPELRHEV